MLELNNFQNEVPNDGDGKRPLSLYSPFGEYAGTMRDQGFYPETDPDSNGQVVFRNKYNKAFNDVVIPDSPNEKGDIAFIGRPNQRFDVVIRDKQGNIRHTMFKGIAPADIQKLLTQNQGAVGTRDAYVEKTTPPIATNNLPMGNMFQ